MPLAVGNILKFTANQLYLEQLMQNVFFYQLMDAPEGIGVPDQLQTMLEAFQAEVMDPVRGRQVSEVLHTTYRVDNLSDGVTFGELLVNQTGQASGEETPSFNAVNVKLVRSTGITRNGSKRIGGIPESAMQGNTLLWDSTDRNAIQAAFGTAIHNPVGLENILAPVIVGRTLTVDEDGEESYVLDLEKINPVLSAFVTGLSTQRSRKAGHGV